MYVYVYTYNIIVSSQTVKPLGSAAFWLRRHKKKAIFGAMEQIKKQMKHLAKICHASRCCRWPYI